MTETTPETPAAHLAPPAASPPATTTVETPPALEALRAEAQRTERERTAGIDGAIDAARALVGAETAAHIRREAVERGWHPDQARRSLFDAMVKSATPPAIPARPESGPGHDSPSEILDAMAEALAARSMPGYQPQSAGRHAEFMGWRPSDTCDKTGVLFEIAGWFSSRQVVCPWHRLKVTLEGGRLTLADPSERKAVHELPLATTDNALALYFLINKYQS